MKAYELIGQVDAARQVHATLPANAPLTYDDVRVIVLLPESHDKIETHWPQDVAREWATELSDECEDIYSLEDGETD